PRPSRSRTPTSARSPQLRSTPRSAEPAAPWRARYTPTDLDRMRPKRRETMTNDLGVWTADDCALVLIDYRQEMFEVIRSETSADLVEMQVRLLAKTAKAFDLPIVLTT